MALMADNARPIDRIDNPGVKAQGQLLQDLRHEVARLLGRNQITFPGAQPVSFARQHLDDLMQKEYVCLATVATHGRPRQTHVNRVRNIVITYARRPTAFATSST